MVTFGSFLLIGATLLFLASLKISSNSRKFMNYLDSLMLFLQTSIVRRPLCPTFVHDETTRVVICVVGIVLCLYANYKILKYFNS